MHNRQEPKSAACLRSSCLRLRLRFGLALALALRLDLGLGLGLGLGWFAVGLFGFVSSRSSRSSGQTSAEVGKRAFETSKSKSRKLLCLSLTSRRKLDRLN